MLTLTGLSDPMGGAYKKKGQAGTEICGKLSNRAPFWSPDSRSIGFFAGGKLKRIDVGGGPPQALVNAPAGSGGAWNRDGTIVFSAGSVQSPLYRISASGGVAVAITRLDPPRQTGHGWPQFGNVFGGEPC